MNKVVVKSRYNKKYHYKFYSFHLLRKSSSIYLFLIAGALSIYLAISNTVSPESTPASKAISWGLVMFILFSIPFFSYGRIKGIIKRNEKERQDSVEIMEFTKYKITRFIENVEGKAVLGWEHFESIYEFEDYFLMYIDSDRGLVVVKEDIVEGSPEVFEKLARDNMRPNKKGKINYKKMYKENK